MRSKHLFLALCALASSLGAAEFKPAMMIEGRGLYEAMEPGTKGSLAQSANVFLVPAVSFGNRTSFTPVLAYLLQGRGQELPEDGLYLQRHTFLAKPQLRFKATESFDGKIWLSAKRAINREVEGEAWSLGVYDWEEFSAGLASDGKLGGDTVEKLGFSLEFLHRGYPNWHEGAPQLTRNQNYYTKDYYGLKYGLDFEGKFSEQAGWTASASYLQKFYTDNVLVKKDASLDYLTSRYDGLLRLEVGFTVRPSAAWTLGVALRGDGNSSNQGFYDQAALVGYEDYYSYLAGAVNPTATWAPEGARGVSVGLGVDLMGRRYSNRPVRRRDGSFAPWKQEDIEQTYSVDVRLPFGPEGLAAVGSVRYLNVSSDQQRSPVLPTYEITTSSLGLQYRM